jgi:hypothetical protein
LQENRLAQVESQLTPRQRVLAWTYRQQQLGGFVDVVTRAVETNGASSPPLILGDIDSVFTHECVAAFNIRVLELQEAHLEKGLLSLCLKRFMRTGEVSAEELEIQSLREALKVFVLKGVLLERALTIVSDDYFAGMRILYDDTAESLTVWNQTAQKLRTIFNDELAAALGVEPITPDELDDYLRDAAPREAEKITALARAKAEFDFGNRLVAFPLVAKVMQQSAQPQEPSTIPSEPVGQ